MRNFLASVFVSAAVLCAQGTSVSTTTDVDINGHRVQKGPDVITTKTATGAVTTETMQSINGRMVPLERVEERVLRDDASGRVVERIVRRYDSQGNPAPPTRETIEETKRSDGSSTTTSSTYRTDFNGNTQLAQKSVTETHKSGGEERSETVVQRPSINGSLDTVEKQEQVKVAQPGGYRDETTTYRPSDNGGFYAAVRTVTDHTDKNGQSTDNAIEYEANPGGALQVHSQTVTKTVTAPDGSKGSVVDIYATSVPGTVDAPGSALKLQEQQLVDSQKGPGGTVTQTLSVRRPTVSDPNTLGPARQISQTVCKGDCKP
ncbi:MAG TPA: hypothetical protein VMH05_04075 [Bryobacteraceae bacterium]|nr:hypothetical protein [Bryobacteraceae bacterium]